jgi:hypothetical protein
MHWEFLKERTARQLDPNLALVVVHAVILHHLEESRAWTGPHQKLGWVEGLGLTLLPSLSMCFLVDRALSVVFWFWRKQLW